MMWFVLGVAYLLFSIVAGLFIAKLIGYGSGDDN